jgi:hypothetical protein
VLSEKQRIAVQHAECLLKQEKHSKNKRCSLHASAADCISKGTAHKRYAFVIKACFATTQGNHFGVDAYSFTGHLDDGAAEDTNTRAIHRFILLDKSGALAKSRNNASSATIPLSQSSVR